jgi:hypothetical protein
MYQLLLAKAQIQLSELLVFIQSEKWDKDPPWIQREPNGQFGKNNKSKKDKDIVDTAKIIEIINKEFDKAAKPIEYLHEDLIIYVDNLEKNSAEQISDTILSDSSKEIREQVRYLLNSVSSQASESFDLALEYLEKSFKKNSLQKAIDSALNVTRKAAQTKSKLEWESRQFVETVPIVWGTLVACASITGFALSLTASVVSLGINAAVESGNYGLFLAYEEARKIAQSDTAIRVKMLNREIDYLRGGKSKATKKAITAALTIAMGILLSEVTFDILEDEIKTFANKLKELDV